MLCKTLTFKISKWPLLSSPLLRLSSDLVVTALRRVCLPDLPASPPSPAQHKAHAHTHLGLVKSSQGWSPLAQPGLVEKKQFF